MKHLFIDTNVAMDLLSGDRPQSEYAKLLFNLADKGKINLYISAISYSHIFYVMKKQISANKLIDLMQEIEEITATIDVTKDVISKALKSNFKDFEDAIQYYTALSNKKVDAIITLNGKDFKNSDLAILTPLEVLSLIENVED